MAHIDRIIFTLAIIFISLSLGWFCHYYCDSRNIYQELLARLRIWLQNAAIFFLMPLAAAFSLWGLPKPDPELLILPLLGLAAYIAGGCEALALAKIFGLSRAEAGSLFCCGTFTNIGAVGALVCLLFLGENSIAFVMLYRIFEEIYYFSIAFPVAEWFGKPKSRLNWRSFKISPVVAVIICALLLGLCLNALNVPRPDCVNPIVSTAVIAGAVCLLFAIGLNLRLGQLSQYWRQSLLACLIKFIGVPCVIVPLAWLFGMGEIEDGQPLKTVAILCSMPVAMTALIPPALFKLDVNLANACWIASTLGLIFVLPILQIFCA